MLFFVINSIFSVAGVCIYTLSLVVCVYASLKGFAAMAVTGRGWCVPGWCFLVVFFYGVFACFFRGY